METKGKLITAFAIMGMVIIVAVVMMIINTAASSTYNRSSGKNAFGGVINSSIASGDNTTRVFDLSQSQTNVFNYLYATSGQDARLTIGFNVTGLNNLPVSGSWERNKINNTLTFIPTNSDDRIVVKLSEVATVVDDKDACKVIIRWVPAWDRKVSLSSVKTEAELQDNMLPLVKSVYCLQDNERKPLSYKLSAKITEKQNITPIYLSNEDKNNLVSQFNSYKKVHFSFIEELPEWILKKGSTKLSSNQHINLIKTSDDSSGELYIYSDLNTVMIAPQSCQDLFKDRADLVEVELFNFYTNATNTTSRMFYNCPKLSKIWVDKATLNLSGVTLHTEMFNLSPKIVGYYPSGEDADILPYDSGNASSIAYAKVATSAGGYFTDRYMADNVQNYINRIYYASHTLLSGSQLRQAIRNIGPSDLKGVTFGKFADYSASLELNWDDEDAVDVTKGQSGNIKLFVKDKEVFILHCVADAADDSDVRESILANPDCSYSFMDFEKLKYIKFDNFDTRLVTNMEGMFIGCSGLNSLDLSSFDTSKVINMDEMFKNCSRLITIMSGSDIKPVIESSGIDMFAGCIYLRGYYTATDYNEFSPDQLYSDNAVLAEQSKGYLTPTSIKDEVETAVEQEFGNMLVSGAEFQQILSFAIPYQNGVQDTLKDIIFCTEENYTDNYYNQNHLITQSDLSFLGNEHVILHIDSTTKTGYITCADTIRANKDCSNMFNDIKVHCVTIENLDVSNVINMNNMFDSDYIMAIFSNQEWGNVVVSTSENMFGPMVRGYYTYADGEEPKLDYCLNYVQDKPAEGNIPAVSAIPRDIKSAVFATQSNAFNDSYGIDKRSFRGMFTNIANVSKQVVLDSILAEAPYIVKSGNLFDIDDYDTIVSVIFGKKETYQSVVSSAEGEDVSYFGSGKVKRYITEKTIIVPKPSPSEGTETKIERTVYILNEEENSKIYGSTYGNTFNIYNVPALREIDFSNFDTSGVATMESMFSINQGAVEHPLKGQLTSLDISTFDTHKVENMREMFYATALQVIYISNLLWDRDKVITHKDMFTTSDKLRGFYNDSGSLKYYAFRNSNSAEDVNKSHAYCGDTGYMTDVISKDEVTRIFEYMIDKELFKETISSSVTKIIFGQKNEYWDDITNAGGDLLNSVTVTTITKFSSDKVKLYYNSDENVAYVLSEENLDEEIYFDFNSSEMFKGLTSLETIEFENVNTTMVRYYASMFKGCTYLKTIYARKDFSKQNADNEEIGEVFSDCTALRVDIDDENYCVYNTARVDVNMAKIYSGGEVALGYFTALELKPTESTP